MRRRSFLTGLPGLGLGCGAEPMRETTPTSPTGTEPLDPFGSALLVGDVQADGAVVSVHTAAAALDFTLTADGAEIHELPRRQVLDEFIQFELTGLRAGVQYELSARAPDDALHQLQTMFRTPPPPGSQEPITFAATSCLGNFARPWRSLCQAAEMELDFMLFLGDTIYTQETTLDGYRSAWRTLLAKRTFRGLAERTSIVALWDDHEVANNWREGKNVSMAQVANAGQAFREALPQRIGVSGGFYRQLSWGDHLELFLLDTRSERADRRLMDPAQLDWVAQAVASSPAQFKIVCSTVHVADHRRAFDDSELSQRWQGYPQERRALVAALADANAVVLTGDMHYGGVQFLAPLDEPGSNVVEVACGPAGSVPNEDWRLVPESPQYPLFVEGNTVSRFVADPAAGTLTVDFVDGTGATVATRVLATA